MATAQADADNAAAPLDQLLVDVGAGPLRRWLPGRPGVEFIASLAGKPRKVGRRMSTMVGELDCVVLGRSAVEPKRGDRRFGDPAWTHNPWLRRLVQAYLATGDAVAGLVDDAALAWRSDQQIRFLAENLIEAISPSNVLLVNPASAKAVVDLVQSGQQVFVISWRNPRADGAAWGMDTYGEAIVGALGAIGKICEIDRMLLLAACSGGIITSMLLGHLAARGRLDRIAGLGLLVTVLDQTKAGLPAVLVSKAMLDRAAARSARKGYLDGATLAELFAWLRPGDPIWNYWVNNYLLGREPPVFDILSWNADTTRMSAALHRDFLTVAGANQLITPGAATMMGTSVDLSAVGVDNYVVAGAADHLCSWQNCDRQPTRQPEGQLPGGRREARGRRAMDADVPTRPAPISSRAEISLAKTGKDLVTMSETPITQQAEAAVTRINQLTERMLTAARNAGGVSI